MALLRLIPLLAMLDAGKEGRTTNEAVKEKEGAFKELFGLLQAEMSETGISDTDEKSALLEILNRYEKERESETLPIDFSSKKGARSSRSTPIESPPPFHFFTEERDLEETETSYRPMILDELSAKKTTMVRIPAGKSYGDGKKEKEVSKRSTSEILMTKNPKHAVPFGTAFREKAEETPEISAVSTSNAKPLSWLLASLQAAAQKAEKMEKGKDQASVSLNLRMLRSNEALQTGNEIRKTENAVSETVRIEDLLETAKRNGLDPKEIVVEKDFSASSGDRKNNLYSKIPERYPEQSAHISRSVATLLRKTGANHPEGRDGSKASPESMQTLSAPETETGSPLSVHKSGSVRRDNPLKDLMQRFALRKPSGPSGQEAPAKKERADIGTETSIEKHEAKKLSTSNPPMHGETETDVMLQSGEHLKTNEALHHKIVDAKTTVRHFAQALQQQVENYKPPFTRMKMTLEPKELGTVELTLVNRGNNLHIQVHSNPNAIGIMATQGQELKNQLVSMGFTDVQMQFNMNQQRQQQQRQQGRSGASYGSTEEIPEFYESLDITLPQYV